MCIYEASEFIQKTPHVEKHDNICAFSIISTIFKDSYRRWRRNISRYLQFSSLSDSYNLFSSFLSKFLCFWMFYVLAYFIYFPSWKNQKIITAFKHPLFILATIHLPLTISDLHSIPNTGQFFFHHPSSFEDDIALHPTSLKTSNRHIFGSWHWWLSPLKCSLHWSFLPLLWVFLIQIAFFIDIRYFYSWTFSL